MLLNADPASALVASPRQGILLHHVCHQKPIVLPLVQKLCNDPRAALQKDNQGNLPIHVVLERRDLSQVPKDVMLALIRVNPASMREKDHDGNLPLHSGLERGDAVTKDVIKAMLDAYPGAAVVTERQRWHLQERRDRLAREEAWRRARAWRRTSSLAAMISCAAIPGEKRHGKRRVSSRCARARVPPGGPDDANL